jgi:hypothetical protein
LPSLPDIVEVPLSTGGQAEVYLAPGSAGPNEFHLIVPSAPSVTPRVTAAHNGGQPQRLRQFTLSPGHYVDFVVTTPGTWRFSVSTRIGHRPVTFEVTRTVSS